MSLGMGFMPKYPLADALASNLFWSWEAIYLMWL